MSALPEVVTARQLAAALGPAFNERSIYRLHDAGIPRIKLGRKVVYEVSAVRAWLESQRVGNWPTASNDPERRLRVV